MEPERELWSAVLHQAISELVGIITDRENRAIVQQQARAWFMSARINVGSFHWVCQILDLDVAAVRQSLFQMSTQEIVARLRNFYADAYRWGQPDEYPVSHVKTSRVPAKEGELWSK